MGGWLNKEEGQEEVQTNVPRMQMHRNQFKNVST